MPKRIGLRRMLMEREGVPRPGRLKAASERFLRQLKAALTKLLFKKARHSPYPREAPSARPLMREYLTSDNVFNAGINLSSGGTP